MSDRFPIEKQEPGDWEQSCGLRPDWLPNIEGSLDHDNNTIWLWREGSGNNEATDAIGRVTVDYYDGEIRILVYGYHEEELQAVTIHNFAEKGEDLPVWNGNTGEYDYPMLPREAFVTNPLDEEGFIVTIVDRSCPPPNHRHHVI